MRTKFFMRFPGGRAKAFTLSYDDGVEQDIRFIEIMDKYALKGTFNLNSGITSPEGTKFPKGQIHRMLPASALKQYYGKNGNEVATHGYTHPWLEKLTPAGVVYEIMKDREELEDMFGRIVRGHAYPYGTYSDGVVDALRQCGIVYARTIKSTLSFDMPTDWLRLHPTCHHDDPKLFELIENFKAYKGDAPKLFYVWGHTYEFEQKDNWDRAEEMCKAISGCDDIWYATNMEIYEYTKAYEALVFSADMTKVHNPTSTEVFFSLNKKEYSIAPGETVFFE